MRKSSSTFCWVLFTINSNLHLCVGAVWLLISRIVGKNQIVESDKFVSLASSWHLGWEVWKFVRKIKEISWSRKFKKLYWTFNYEFNCNQNLKLTLFWPIRLSPSLIFKKIQYIAFCLCLSWLSRFSFLLNISTFLCQSRSHWLGLIYWHSAVFLFPQFLC